ncbi:hypothetical protein SAY86_007196 [Trapa natans]|uniref:Glutaredoxin domain-containing protein n=1 Tax=Trapa natans TaxID=22666 RepID=A0AAN7QXM1_TRANT|nr:hypothetical protein SAY86_007196 [Trapa natans]
MAGARLKNTKSIDRSRGGDSSSIGLPGTEDRIVVYLTSLRGIPLTYEDCHGARMIFRGFRVWVDERDISMDMAYKKELQSIVGGGKHMGGVDVIRYIYMTGELAMILKGYPKMDPRFVCDYCGDVRFMPCNCSGVRRCLMKMKQNPRGVWSAMRTG